MRKAKGTFGVLAGVSTWLVLSGGKPVMAAPYTVSYTDGGSYSTVYAQGFSTSLGATPAPAASVGDTVDLSQFSFYKSGDTDSASNIQLAIFNTMYPNTVGLTTSSSSFVGLSTNTLSNDSSVATGAPLAFSFNNLPLQYGSDYSAVFVNVDPSGDITPVLVSALTANYVLESDNNYHPATNYGTESQYQYTTSNYISGGYFSAFNYAGDADFSASLATVPEPGIFGVIALGSLLLLRSRSRSLTI